MLKRLSQSSRSFLSESKQIVSRNIYEKTGANENEWRKVDAKQKRAVALTKEKCIQAFIRHVLINQHHLFSFNTATKKSHKIPVLEFRNHHNFIHELFKPLTRCSRESFHNYFLSIWQFSLQWCHIKLINTSLLWITTTNLQSRRVTLYTAPKPPCPSLLDTSKLFVAVSRTCNLKSGSSLTSSMFSGEFPSKSVACASLVLVDKVSSLLNFLSEFKRKYRYYLLIVFFFTCKNCKV